VWAAGSTLENGFLDILFYGNPLPIRKGREEPPTKGFTMATATRYPLIGNPRGTTSFRTHMKNAIVFSCNDCGTAMLKEGLRAADQEVMLRRFCDGVEVEETVFVQEGGRAPYWISADEAEDAPIILLRKWTVFAHIKSTEKYGGRDEICDCPNEMIANLVARAIEEKYGL
jgi:hypothetical protein